nr:ribonuclease H-like domain-containing protein [Tanacetum cinerariifolium]
MFDCDETFTSESDERLPPSPIYDRYQSGDEYHAVPPPYTGTFIPPKPDLIFRNALNVNETVYTAFNVELSPTKPDNDLSYTYRPSALIIEDWISDSEDNFKAEIPQNAPSFVQPTKQVKTPRPSVKTLKTSIPATTKTAILKPTGIERHALSARPVTAVVPKSHVTRPRLAKTIVTKPIHHLEGTLTMAHPLKPVIFLHKLLLFRFHRHMTWNMSYLSDSEAINGGYVAFGENLKGGKISGKGKIRTGKLDFDDVYFVKELKFNIFSFSHMCDKKNSVLFTDNECLVLSFEFKLPDENQVLLRVPKENNMYNVDLRNIVPSGDLTCLFANATLDESNLWHRRMGHINFKTMNKLVKGKRIKNGAKWVFLGSFRSRVLNIQDEDEVIKSPR